MTTERRTGVPELVAVAVIVLVGAVVRAWTPFAADFPLNDGGLFYRMILDLRETWPALPETTTYNGLDAPFAYPPLGFYLGAVLEPLLGLDVMRVVPVVFSVGTIAAFYLLARSLVREAAPALAATAAFALMPRTFEWVTMGGGLTRAPGLLLAILALWLTHRVLRGAGWGSALGAGVLGGLVALTHPQAAMFTVLSGVLFAAWMLRDRTTLLRLAAALGVAVIVALPWLVTMFARDGGAALLSASGTQPGPFIGLLSLFTFEITGSRLFDIVRVLAAVGLVVSVLRRRWMIPTWLIAVLILDARGGANYAAIPASILAGGAFVDLVVHPIWRRVEDEPAPRGRALPKLDPLRAGVAAVIGVVAVLDAFGSQLAPTWPAYALSPDQRAAVESAGADAPDGEFLVVSGRYWPVDATAEWFPVLSGARSVGTVQGNEWLGTDAFDLRADASEALRLCTEEGPACLAAWAEEWDTPFTHVFLPRGALAGPLGDTDCCTALRLMLESDPGYRLVEDFPGGTVFERIDG